LKQEKGNLWDYIGKTDVLCITTNGFVKKSGEAVMGRGCASQAKDHYPGISLRLGIMLTAEGNMCHELWKDDKTLVYSFPVKHDRMVCTNKDNLVPHMRERIRLGDVAPGWALKADVDLIIKSANELLHLANTNNWSSIVIPRPGCGAGELHWSTIGPILSQIFDNRFTAVTFA
jgi:hypothetical protein